MSKSISYSKLDKTLRKLKAHIGPAETHGLMTGVLSIDNKIHSKQTMQDVIIENLDCAKPTKSQLNVLNQASIQISDNLDKLNCEFSMLLPNDEQELAERIDALGYWCRGYLSGLGLAGVTADQLQNENVKELVHDLSQIAHVSIETDDSEEDEANYIELVEYVRVAVQNIRVELRVDAKTKVLH